MLTVLCIIAALLVAWLAAALEQAVRGLAASAAGIPFRGLQLAEAPPWLVTASLGAPPALAPATWALVVLSGTAGLVVVFLAAYGVIQLARAGGITRALVLEGAVLALLWTPTMLAAAGSPGGGGGGPAAELYRRLGDPQAGRWTAPALGLVLLVLLAPAVTNRAVAIGRAWMRADGQDFRRRLVRVVAGYPAAVALFALMVVAGWAGPAWAAGWCLVMLLTLRFRTR